MQDVNVIKEKKKERKKERTLQQMPNIELRV
jgi:hypothetical protein